MSGKPYAGTVTATPFRVQYEDHEQSDFFRAEEALKNAGIRITGRKVMSVPPYHATIFVAFADESKAAQVLKAAGIQLFPVTPVY
ncbi:MAG: hypothetical protein M1294_13395 [Firmicutes bacterium]|uniref:SPOR domain-containing protein n=1 Tax=Sulfobacillus benefaciens TaxID=453960 RepID=A0A2T2WS86_9FIRM|nr:hypothetical protein [Bacillota bacterium]MCL5012818.1 hypothetical protein [Bacillota bacterium]PSR25108.1 MAG: hypothetical protein C7B43_17585 [Sulfobacillus benefaciens]